MKSIGLALATMMVTALVAIMSNDVGTVQVCSGKPISWNAPIAVGVFCVILVLCGVAIGKDE